MLWRTWPRAGTTLILATLMILLQGACPADPRYLDCVVVGDCECRGPGDCPGGQQCINGQCGFYPDAAVDLLGFGEICLHDSDCNSNFCIPSASGAWNVCTRSCEADCPAGWDCKQRGDSEPVWLCVEHLDRLCLGCSVDAHCHPAFGDRCVELGDGSRVCGQDCSLEGCPAGYSCVAGSAGAPAQCQPSTGTCECNLENIGLVVGCTRDNAFGSCHGTTSCLASGDWSPCSADTAGAEICNGQDDDCDALIDSADDSIDISVLPVTPPYPRCQLGTAPSCRGIWSCQIDDLGAFDWVCDATEPEDDICDGLDNDCDGETDEDFLDDQGRYAHPAHCGGCGLDCGELIPGLARNAAGEVADDAAVCDLVGDQRTCLPVRCATGFALFPELAPVTCLPLISPQCRPCSTVSDCALSTDRCEPVGLDPHGSCLQSCAPGSAYGPCGGLLGQQDCCPDGHLCQLQDGAALCLPAADSCDCDPDNLGVSRSCFVPGSADAVCVGQQTCRIDPTGVAAWTECDASTTSVEICDGADNDCNGVVDDPFIDTQGSASYDVDAHCGACNINCPARWSEEIQHAIGGCVLGEVDNLPGCRIVACTQDQVVGRGSCRQDGDCVAGEVCDPTFLMCVRSCAGPADCPGADCLDGFCATSCSSDNECRPAPGETGTCVAGHCEQSIEFHDADGLESNGCECPAPLPAQQDEPEIFDSYPDPGVAYPDRDCDGVDGDAAAALFVWSGSPDSRGTREAPYQTLREAQDAFDPASHSQILVAAGEYREHLNLRAGVRIYGGYAPDFGQRDVVLYPSLIIGSESDVDPEQPGVVNAIDITSPRTVLAGFVIYGYDMTELPPAGRPGLSAYAIYIRNSNGELTLANNVVIAGRGGRGGHGNSGQTGGAGRPGGEGNDSVECATARCRDESQSGGAGGNNPSCSEAAGRPGALASGDADPQGYASAANGDGLGGGNGAYSSAFNPEWRDLCKYDCTVAEDMNGDAAQSGVNGSDGAGGSGCSNNNGQIANGLWRAGSAGTGLIGRAGRGGGGGGAGGCVINENPGSCSIGNRVGDLGGTGGGGGAGGCGGTGGAAGAPGGGSFAVFLGNNSSIPMVPVIQGNVLYRAEGGAGGDGGDGGHGGLGGAGGSGGVPVNPAWCAGFGGKGGRGGDGGGGGGGGGGCGGISYAIAGNQDGITSYRAVNSFPDDTAPLAGGPPGGGGASPAGSSAAGDPGSTGLGGDLHAF